MRATKSRSLRPARCFQRPLATAELPLRAWRGALHASKAAWRACSTASRNSCPFSPTLSYSFHEAVTCFADPLGLLLEDEAQPERLVLIGVSEKARVLYTVFAELADDVVRIITARKATTHERRRYEEGE